jgi:MtN3 and saliva related transmembrane protein
MRCGYDMTSSRPESLLHPAGPMTLIDTIGTIGAVLTTLCWLPQVVKVVFGKDTRSISLPTFLVLATGIVCWIVYGIALDNLPLIGANAVSLALVLIILAAKLRYG